MSRTARRRRPAGQSPAPDTPRVLIVGGGFAAFHCARELERLLDPDEAQVTLASPNDYMLYSPLLPHVAAGTLNPTDIAVPLRRTLHRTLRAPCSIIGVDLERKVCVAHPVIGKDHLVPWDRLALCPGSVTRTFSIPGLIDHGRGMKTLAEARGLRDHVLAQLELGNTVSDPAERASHCTFVVVGAGYAGAETAALLQSFTRRALSRFINLRPHDLHWMLVDVAKSVLPELGEELGATALGMLHKQGIDVRLGVSVEKVEQTVVHLSDGDSPGCRTLVWTAGVTASPLLATLGLETGRSGRLVVTPTLQTPEHPDVFAAGDAAAVPDLTQEPGAITPPTAQHAQRQGVTLARNIAHSLRGEPCEDYRHHNLGLVVDLGGTRSVAKPLGLNLHGLPAQVVSRGYHLSALPSMRARSKAAASWVTHAALGEDYVRVGDDAGTGTLGELRAEARYLSADEARALADELTDSPG